MHDCEQTPRRGEIICTASPWYLQRSWWHEQENVTWDVYVTWNKDVTWNAKRYLKREPLLETAWKATWTKEGITETESANLWAVTKPCSELFVEMTLLPLCLQHNKRDTWYVHLTVHVQLGPKHAWILPMFKKRKGRLWRLKKFLPWLYRIPVPQNKEFEFTRYILCSLQVDGWTAYRLVR